MSKMKSIGKMLTVMALAGMLLVLSIGASLASQPSSADENKPHGCSACEERQSASQIDDDISTSSNEPPTDLVGTLPSPTALRNDAGGIKGHINTPTKLSSTRTRQPSTRTKLSFTRTRLPSTRTRLSYTRTRLSYTRTRLPSTRTRLPCTHTILPAKPTLISPTGTIGTSNPTYLWRCVPGATQYLLKVANANTPGTAIIEKWYDAASVVSNQGCSVKPGVILPEGYYRWWIQAKNSKGTGPLSSYNSFRFASVSPGNVSPISPRGLISTRRPTFAWTPISSATRYNLQVIDSSEAVVIDEWYQAEDVTSGARASAASPMTLSGGIYYWRVRASNDAGTGSWSGYKYFEIVCASKASQAETQSDPP